MDALASFSRSRGVGTIEPPGRTRPFLRPVSKGKTLPAGSTFPRTLAGPSGPPVGNCPTMELHEAIRRRAMVRSFSTEPVARDVVDRILAGRPALPHRRQHPWHGLGGPRGARADGHSTSTPPTDAEWRARAPRMATGCGGRRWSCSPTPRPTPTWPATPSRTRRLRASATARRALAGPLLVRGRRLRRHGGPAGRGRRRAGSLHPGGVPGRGRAGRPLGCPRRLAPLLRRGAGPRRRQATTARPPSTGRARRRPSGSTGAGGHAPPPGAGPRRYERVSDTIRGRRSRCRSDRRRRPCAP